MRKHALAIAFLSCVPLGCFALARAAESPATPTTPVSPATPAGNAFDEDTGKVPLVVPVISLEQAWQKLPAYKFGDSRVPLLTIQKAVVATPKTEAQLGDLTTRFVALLGDANASRESKKFACRQLTILGGTAPIPALQTLLLGDDPDLALAARYALERNEAPQALTVLRDALDKTKALVLIGVVTSLGVRRDAESLPAIAKLTANADPQIAGAALTALGTIGSPEALTALGAVGFAGDSPLLPIAQHAALRAAATLARQGQTAPALEAYQKIFTATAAPSSPARIAAWRGLVATDAAQAGNRVVEALKGDDLALQQAAVGVATELPEAAVETVAKALSQLPVERQVQLLTAFTNQTHASVREAASGALKSENEDVRVAALGTLTNAGDASTVALLVGAAANGTPREKVAAQNSLGLLRGAPVDAGLIARLKDASPVERAVLARALGMRHAAGATPVLLKAAADDEENVRVAALDALAQTAVTTDVPSLLDLQVKALATGGKELTAAEKALAAATLNGTDSDAPTKAITLALNGADAARRASLLRALGLVGTSKAISALIVSLKDIDATVRDTVVRILSNSTEQGVAPALLDVVQTGDTPAHKVLAFRGFVRLAGNTSLKASDRLKMYQAALPVALAGEKKAVLAGLGSVANLESLKIVLPFLDDESLREEAAAAVNAISDKMVPNKPTPDAKETLRGALKKVIEVSKNDALRQKATDNLKKL